MVAFQSRFGVIAAMLTLSACGGQGPLTATPQDFIPVSSVLNAVRCEFASFMIKHPKAPFVGAAWQITGELQVKIIHDANSSVGASFAPLSASPITFGFGLGYEHSTNTTRDTTFKFEIPTTIPKAACPRSPDGGYLTSPEFPIMRGLGLEQWLEATVAYGPGGTTIGATEYAYGLDFSAVSKTSLNEGVFEVVPIKISASGFNKRNDVQGLDISITPVPQRQDKTIRIDLTSRSAGGAAGADRDIKGVMPGAAMPQTMMIVGPNVGDVQGASDPGAALRASMRAQRRP